MFASYVEHMTISKVRDCCQRNKKGTKQKEQWLIDKIILRRLQGGILNGPSSLVEEVYDDVWDCREYAKEVS